MNKYLILLMLCLFAFACEQESITSELTTPNDQIADRGTPCDLAQVPLYIPPTTNVQGNIDFSSTFSITKSTDYESSNNTTVSIQNISYSVNGMPASDSSFAQQNNTSYNLNISVTYFDGAWNTDEFSIQFKVNNEQLIWESRNSCLYDDGRSNEIETRTIEAVILAD